MFFFSLAGTPRSEVQEEVECAPSPHLSLTLKVRKPQATTHNDQTAANITGSEIKFFHFNIYLQKNSDVKLSLK